MRSAGVQQLRQRTLLAGSALEKRPLRPVLIGALIAAFGLAAAHSIPSVTTEVPGPLAGLLAFAITAIFLTLRTEHLFLGWLFAAPLLQESASRTHAGHLLSLVLYTAPPVILLAKTLASRGWTPRREWFDYAPAIFVGLLLASLAITAPGELRSAPTGTLRGFYQNVVIGVIIYYVVAFWRGPMPALIRIAKTILLAAALQAAMAVAEWSTGWNLWHDTTWQGGIEARSIATLANPAVTGGFIGVGIVVALAILCWDGPRDARRLAIVMVAIGVPALFATKTRGPILATVVASALCLLLSSRTRVVGAGIMALVALTLFALWPQIKATPVYRNRLSDQQNVQARVVLQDVSIRLAEERPFFGWGYDSFDRVKFTVPVTSDKILPADALQSTSHDTFLTMLVELGAIGLVVYLLPWVRILARVVRIVRAPSNERWFLIAGLASILVIGIDGATLDYRFFSFLPMVAWLFLGLIRRKTHTTASNLGE